MSLRDNATRTVPLLALAPGTYTASANGTTVDLQGYHGVTFLVASGTITDGTSYAFKLQESDDGSSWSDVASGDLIGSFTTWAATDDNKTQNVGYKGNKRYVRLVMTVTGATSGGAFAAIAAAVPEIQGTV